MTRRLYVDYLPLPFHVFQRCSFIKTLARMLKTFRILLMKSCQVIPTILILLSPLDSFLSTRGVGAYDP